MFELLEWCVGEANQQNKFPGWRERKKNKKQLSDEITKKKKNSKHVISVLAEEKL